MPEQNGGIDVTAIRQALRLVHCLQKERGASCSYHMSKSLTSKRLTVEPARRDTDRALDKALKQCVVLQNVVQSAKSVLEKIRKSMETNAQDVSYHRMLATYNCLISAIVHDGILKQTKQRQQRQTRNNNHNKKNNSIVPDLDGTVKKGNQSNSNQQHLHNFNRARTPSDHDLMDLRGRGGPITKPQHRRLKSDAPRSISPPTDYSSLLPENMFVDHHHHGDDDNKKNDNGNKHLARIDSIESMSDTESAEAAAAAAASKATAARQDEAVQPNPQVSEDEEKMVAAQFNDDEDGDALTGGEKLSQLMHLLEIFVALSESIGVERATLCSILAFGPESHHLLNDLVLEVENQRNLVQQLLRCKCDGVSSLNHYIQDLVILSPTLQDLQQRLLTGNTDSMEKDFDSGKLWNMLTVYIDKLHTFELLILEEIEYALEDVDEDDAESEENQRLKWSTVFGKYERIEKLKDQVDSLPADDVKVMVLAAMRKQIGNKAAFPEGEVFRKSNSNDDAEKQNGDEDNNGTSEENRLDAMLKELSSAPPSKEWEIDLYQIRFKKRIGQGAAGTTYLADWNGTNVAVKVASITEMGLEGWRTEVQALQKLHHPNIIRLMGSVYHPNPLTFCLVLEYCDAGDLDTAMQRVAPRNFVPHVALSMAKGMTYLHKRGVIHRDIKPLNVLLNGNVSGGNFDVKVTDFGVATELTQGGGLRTAETGTYRWMAPEVIRHEAYSETADVFSFGIVLWQLVTRELPYEDKSTFEAAAAVAMESLRPPFPSGIPDSYRELVEQCWQDDPAKRPHFDDIVEELISLEKVQSEDEKSWFEAPLGHAAYRKPAASKDKNHHAHKEKHVLLQPNVEAGKGHPKNQKGKDNNNKDNNKPGRLKSLFARKSSHF